MSIESEKVHLSLQETCRGWLFARLILLTTNESLHFIYQSMKKSIAVFLIISNCMFSVAALSQSAKIDSLLKSLGDSGQDTNRVNTLNQLCRDYNLAGEFEKAKKCSNDASILSQKLGFLPGKISASLNIGMTYFYEGNFNKALEYFKSAFDESSKANYKKGIANSSNNLGLTFTYQQKYSEALKFHGEALKAYQELNDTLGLSRSYNNHGIIYEEQGNYTEALKYYLSALQMADKLHDMKAIGDAYFNIANVYSGSKSYSEALVNYSKALKQYEKIDFKQGTALCYVNIGLKYQELDSLESGIAYTQKGYVILEAIGDKTSAADTKNTLGHMYVELGNYSKALDNFTTALKVFSEINDTLHMSTSYRGFGEVYFHMGQYNESLKYFTLSLELARVVGNKSNIANCYGSIAEVYEKKNDFKNAYLNHKLYFALSDSLLNETKSHQLAEMQTRFETEKKDIEIVLLNKDKAIQNAEIKKQKLLKFSFIGGFGLVILMLLFGYRIYRTQQNIRLQSIRNKISGDLHDDIGSTLNSISIYSEVARKKDEQQDEALEMIGEASRKIIDAMSDIVWTVNPENDSFEKIIFRMKSLAYNLFRAKKIEFSFHSDESLNEKKLSLDERRNFYLIFKEAINNLVKYSNATRAAITLTNEKNVIRLSIRDDGIGFDLSGDTQGNGLKNMKRRAEEVQAEFKIESVKGNGTQIELILKA